jgi:hypothetical protein
VNKLLKHLLEFVMVVIFVVTVCFLHRLAVL